MILKNLIQSVLIISSVAILTSCSMQKGYVLFDKKQDEKITTPTIKDYFKQNPRPSIVLKAPNSESKSTQSDANSSLYNAIEKELLLAGFDVKDRGLFNEVLSKSKQIDYKELKALTNTDLILELVKISPDVEYGTNKYFKKDDSEATVINHTFKKYGAMIEFKLTLIETNQFAGSYVFNYTPCETKNNDCECEVAYKGTSIYPHLGFCQDPVNSNYDKAFQYISEPILEDFVRSGVKQIIAELRK